MEPPSVAPPPAPLIQPVPSGPNGYVFLCRNATQVECLEAKVFGLSERELERMQSTIVDNTQIFLLNMHSGALVGAFTPVGMPGLNLDPNVFEGNFPAQVKVTVAGPLRAVKVGQRMSAGPKTPEEVDALMRLLLEGTPIDPMVVDETDKSYGYQNPRGKAAKAAKGKGKSKGKFMDYVYGWGYGFGKGFGKGKGTGLEALWMLAYGTGKGYSSSSKVDDSGGVLGDFTGTIKSFVDSKWYGFIECPEITAMGHQDVFLHGDQKKMYRVGHMVKFTACLNKEGKVQAKDLKSGLKGDAVSPLSLCVPTTV